MSRLEAFDVAVSKTVMPIDSSKFFDSIRIKPNKAAAKQPRVREEAVTCEWPGCENRGSHRAPKGRGNEREYFHFCLNHVREYNQSYNFFQGMNADAVARYQKDALTGHRPTWKMGANGAKGKGKTGEVDLEGAIDPFSVFSELNGRGRWRPGPGAGSQAKPETRKIFNAERKALQVMGLDADATLETVKARYKLLVKQHHPDANGGDRSTEDRLIEIIKAYNYLKTVVRGA
jgi:curved DNA-binding protein CbpA